MVVRTVLVALLVLSLGACAEAAPSSQAAEVGGGVSDAPTVDAAGLRPSEGFDVTRLLFSDGDERVAMPAYVADSPALRATGLMNRSDLPDDAGMLFVFDGLHRSPFWMKNTRIPLSIAFVGQDGTVQQLVDMQPCTAEPCERYLPDDAYVLAVEANQGFFTERGITPGWMMEVYERAGGPTWQSG